MSSAYKSLIRRAAQFSLLADEFVNGELHYLITVPAWREADRLRAEAHTVAQRALDRGRVYLTGAGWQSLGEVAGVTVTKAQNSRIIRGLEKLHHEVECTAELAPETRRLLISECLTRLGPVKRCHGAAPDSWMGESLGRQSAGEVWRGEEEARALRSRRGQPARDRRRGPRSITSLG